MINIKKAEIGDVNSIVAIHKQAFPNFFLTTLGDNFLRLYYSCMCKCDGAVTLCAVEEGKVVGFASSALKSAGFNTRLIKSNIIPFMGEAIKLFLTSPMSLVRLVKNFTKKSSSIDDDGDYAELFSIGVSPTCQGKGVGSLLLNENEHVTTRMGGVKRLSLTTDKNNNESAIAFYQKNGYRILYEFTAYPDREMYRFIKDLE